MAKKSRPRSNGDAKQVELLRGIWNEIKTLGQNLGERIDQTNLRLEAVRMEFRVEVDPLRQAVDRLRGETDQLRRVMTESDVRLATSVAELAGDVRTLSDLIRDWRQEHRQDRDDIRRRVERLEERGGIDKG